MLLPLLLIGIVGILAGCVSQEKTESKKDEGDQGQKTDTKPKPNSILPDAYIRKIADGLTEAALNCPERIWPGAGFRGNQVLLFDPILKEAWLWNARLAKGPLETVPFSEVEARPHLMLSTHATTDWNRIPTMFLSVIPPPGYYLPPLAIGIHEGFHYYAQSKGWYRSDPKSRLGQVYPAKPDVHYFKSELLSSLARPSRNQIV